MAERWLKALMMRVNLNAIHFLGSDILHAKKQKYPHNLSTGTGGARAAISQPKAMAATTWTINLCRLAKPCRSLRTAESAQLHVKPLRPTMALIEQVSWPEPSCAKVYQMSRV
jgi:hypothetical protein